MIYLLTFVRLVCEDQCHNVKKQEKLIIFLYLQLRLLTRLCLDVVIMYAGFLLIVMML